MSEHSAELASGSHPSWHVAQQWPHFIATMAAAVTGFAASWYLLRWGDAPLLLAFAFSTALAVLVFDGCWLAGLFGSTWFGAL